MMFLQSAGLTARHVARHSGLPTFGKPIVDQGRLRLRCGTNLMPGP